MTDQVLAKRPVTRLNGAIGAIIQTKPYAAKAILSAGLTFTGTLEACLI